MKFVLKNDNCTLLFKITVGDYWCKADIEIVQDEFYYGGLEPQPYPCKVDCHIIDDESIRTRELWELCDMMEDLYEGVYINEEPHFVEPVFAISFINSHVQKSIVQRPDGTSYKEYHEILPQMVFKINLAAPYGSQFDNNICLRFDPSNTQFFYWYILYLTGQIDSSSRKIQALIKEGIMIDE